MVNPVPKPVADLVARAHKLNALVDKRTHAKVSLPLQSAYGGLMGAANVLAVLFRVGNSIAVDASQSKNRSVRNAALLASKLLVITRDIPPLVGGAELLASGRDVELYKQLGKRSLILAAGIGAKLSGVGYIKDAADILAALKDVADTGQAVKLRRDQVRAASDLFKWADAIALLTIAWCYSAEAVLLNISRKSAESDDAIMARTVKRLARNARSWKQPG